MDVADANHSSIPTTIIVGLGNPILTDDGVGVYVARALANLLQESPDVTITEASVGGLRLMELLAGYDRAILIDAILDDSPPGAIMRMTMEALMARSPTQHIASAHDTSLATAMKAGRRMGLHLPSEIIIYAISVDNVLDFGDTLTPMVAEAVPKVVRAVAQEIGLKKVLKDVTVTDGDAHPPHSH